MPDHPAPTAWEIERARWTARDTANPARRQPRVVAPERRRIPETGRCFRGERCPERERVAGQRRPVGAPINTERGLCLLDEQALKDALHRLPVRYQHLAEHLGELDRQAGELVSGSRERPIVINVHIEAAMSAIDDTLTMWAPPVARRVGTAWDVRLMARQPAEVRIDWAADVLSQHLRVLCALVDEPVVAWVDDERVTVARDGLQGATDLIDLHQRSVRLVGEPTTPRRLPVPCPLCEAAALTHRDGTELVSCGMCRYSESWDAYADRCALLIGASA